MASTEGLPADLAREATLAAARYRLGTITSQEIQDLAKRCLVAGLYSSDVDDMASSSYPVMSEVGPALERFFIDQAISIPSTDEAVWLLLKEHVGTIAERRIAPRDGMSTLERLYHEAHLDRQTREYLGDSHDMHRLLGNYYGYDEVFRASDISLLDEAIVDEALKWMSAHGGERGGRRVTE